jgi:4-amino-4-deoxychorismate lyase
MICEHRLGEHPELAGIKHLNRLDQVLGRAEWGDDVFDEGLMLGQDGRVVCGTMSNVVLERDGDLFTPALTGAGVAGVVRTCLLDQAARRGAPVTVTRLGVADVRMAEAVYLTNALIGVRRVAQCDGVSFDLDRPEPPVLDAVRQIAFRPDLV